MGSGAPPPRPPPADAFSPSYSMASSNNTMSSHHNNNNRIPPGGPQRQGSSSSATQPPPSSSTQTAQTTTAGSSSSSKPAPLSLEQSRQVARTHYDALKDWLTNQGALNNASTRNNAREKLTRLTRQQFQELSTDVYDELVRRLEDAAGRPGEQPFLSVRNDFHPKRNQARQKLATLPSQRFRDLASDVYFELDRRYPEFSDQGPIQSPIHSPTFPRDVSSSSIPRSDSNSSNVQQHVPPSNLAARRAPTPQSSSNDVVVPNKSTLVMEEPSGSFNNSPNLSRSDGNQHQRRESFQSQPGFNGLTKPNMTSKDLINSPSTTSYGSPQQFNREDEQEALNMTSNQQQPVSPPIDGSSSNKMTRASESSAGTRFIGGYGSAPASEVGDASRSWKDEERDKMRSDYEFKITMMQNRITELERENEDASNALKNRNTEQARIRDLENQIRSQQERYDQQSSSFDRLRQDFDTLQIRSRDNASAGGDSTRMRADLERLTHERNEAESLANELRDEVTSLADELRDVNSKYESLLEERERDQKLFETREEEAKTWKKRYEQAKTELRNLKATSQIFSAPIKVEGDYMPASPDGQIADINVSSFQTSIDDLLQAGRSNDVSSVLPAARTVVAAVDKIEEDLLTLDMSTISPQDQEQMAMLRPKLQATLSNLMTASKNHATSFGISPVSLLDAAASHLSATVVDLVRVLKIRRSTAASRMAAEARNEPMPSLPSDATTAPAPPTKPNGYLSGGLSSVKNAFSNFSMGGSSGTNRNSASSPTPSNQSRNAVQQQTTGPMTTSQERSWGAPSSSGAGGRPGSSSWEQHQQQQQDRYIEPQRRVVSPQHRRYDSTTSSNYNERSNAALPNPPDTLSPALPTYNNNSNNDWRNQNSAFVDSQQQFLQQSVYPTTTYRNDEQQQQPSQQRFSGPSTALSLSQSETQLGQSPRIDNTTEELKGYIENQTEAIVHSIQSLLSSMRNGASGQQLNENLTEIITIVSSIVAISKDALNSNETNQKEGELILKDLIENCDKLSEMQSETSKQPGQTFSKQIKQAMAGASFGLAKGLRELNRLLE
ncbi:component of the polarisome [Microbotryomycetes sp. JL221]|nr:component of the polarisome [Microbotryomycetes sp. JL221]